MNRRDFLHASSVLGVTSLIGTSALMSCQKGPVYTPLKQPGEYYIPTLPDVAADGRELKVGLVGCGGRGSGAIQNLLAAANGIKVVALGMKQKRFLQESRLFSEEQFLQQQSR